MIAKLCLTLVVTVLLSFYVAQMAIFYQWTPATTTGALLIVIFAAYGAISFMQDLVWGKLK